MHGLAYLCIDEADLPYFSAKHKNTLLKNIFEILKGYKGH